MGYLTKTSSLGDRASAQVAINLCQGYGFKEVVLCLQKPTYGILMDDNDSSLFITDPAKISTWTIVKESNWQFTHDQVYKVRRCLERDLTEQWNATIDEQCQKLTEGIPCILKQRIHAWINRIALEYLCYSRRQEVLFGISRYFLIDFLTQGDWITAGRLDEKKLAERMIKDERLRILQRYRIACVYCLHESIPQLWEGLTRGEKLSVTWNRYESEDSDEGHNNWISDKDYSWNSNLILLWSKWVYGHPEENLTQKPNWIRAAQEAVCDGNRAALMSCWKKFKSWESRILYYLIKECALQSLQRWESIQRDLKEWKMSWGERLISRDASYFDGRIKFFRVPSCYSELMCFFLSKMDEEQQLTFFKEAFQIGYNVLTCLLDWPYQEDFLSTINRLWEIIPKGEYTQCLLTLVSKYSGNYDYGGFSTTSLDNKETRYYDYQKLLGELWEETPEEYKRYVFLDKNEHADSRVINEGEILLPLLLGKTPFQEKDETLFKQFFLYQPQEERRAMMRSEVGDEICSILIKKEKWSFLNWLLEECLPKEEIPGFKKQFIQSSWGYDLCCLELIENHERFVEDLMDWASDLDTEKTQFKSALIRSRKCLSACKLLLLKGKITEMERLINFCVPSGERTDSVKMDFARNTCKDFLRDWARSVLVIPHNHLLEVCQSGGLLGDIPWQQMDTILAWSVDAEEKINYLKKDIFSDIGIDVHHKLLFNMKRDWEDAKCFYKWFGLSLEEIKQLVIDFKREVEERYFKQGIGEDEKEQLDTIVCEYISGAVKDHGEKRDHVLRDDGSDEIKLEEVFVKGRGEKRSSAVIEDGSSPPKKR